MRDFVYYTPTEVLFGRESESHVAELIKKYGGSKVLIHYGGGSAERSGLLGSIRKTLSDNHIAFVELGGVKPNPDLMMVRKGIDFCRRNGVDFILAVGGGSAIDSSKAIAYGLANDRDVWDFYSGKAVPTAIFPLGVVLTMPASGSEMSHASVITNPDGLIKRACDNDLGRPKFAVMNPERTFSLPPYQTACGITDILMHTMERFFTLDDDMTLTDGIAKSLMSTVLDCAPVVMANPRDYRSRAQIMWAGSLSHNGLTGCGVASDFATHKLEHELSGLFDVAHGAGLAALWGSWARYVYKDKVSRFVDFAVSVMRITEDFSSPETVALKGIEAMESFFHSIGMPVSIPQLLNRPATKEEISEMARKCSRDNTFAIGHFRELGYEDIINIYNLANRS